MSQLKEGAVDQQMDNELGSNIQGFGNLTVYSRGKFLNFIYSPQGGGEVLFGLDGDPPVNKLPDGGWFNFRQSNSVEFYYSAPHPGDDIKLGWNVS
jgi:hypothetical protein